MNENTQINMICFPFLSFAIKILFNVESFNYCKEV